MDTSLPLPEWLTSLPLPHLSPYEFFFLVVAAMLAAWLIQQLPSLSKDKGPPGPSFFWPLIGETPDIFASPQKFMFKRYIKYGEVFKTHILGYKMYVIANTGAVKTLWKGEGVDFFVPGRAFRMLLPDFDHMVIPQQHSFWRKRMSLALSPQAIDGFFPALQRIIDEHLEAWGRQGRLELGKACTSLGLDYGVNVVAGLPLRPETRAQVKALCGTFNAGLYTLPVNLPGTGLRAALNARKQLTDMMARDLQEQLERVGQQCTAARADLDPDVQEGLQPLPPPADLLEAQISGQWPFNKHPTPDNAVQMALGNVVAASDTTRHMLFITICCICQSPRVMAKALEEQKEVMAMHGQDLSLRVINTMTYLDAVTKEAMRLIPAANGGFRKAAQDLQVNGYTIPKGSVVFWSTHLTNMVDRGVWDGSATNLGPGGMPVHMDYQDRFEEAFQPERWLHEDTKPKMMSSFGGGMHLCLGMALAYAEVKLFIVNLIRRYEIKLLDPQVLAKCTMFPGPKPLPGTDMLELTPRDLGSAA